jgi:HK97 family phage major capsid protein
MKVRKNHIDDNGCPGWGPWEISHGADPGDIIGYRKDGRQIRLIAGGARNVYDTWVPEEFGSDVITRVQQMSAMEANANRVPMGSNTRSVPRSAGMGINVVGKGIGYTEDVSANDQVLLTASKFTRAMRVAEEDIVDSLAAIIATKQRDWATSYAKSIDNACIGTTAVGVADSNVPFNSLYYALTQTNATTGYTANTNITTSATCTYAALNGALKLHEVSDYFDITRSIVICHPIFRSLLRGIVDTQNRPIFIEYNDADIQTAATLFGLPIKYSQGARLSGSIVPPYPGNYLIAFVNPDYLQLGIRSGPESAFAPADSGVGFLTDEALLKMRARRAFAIGNEFAASVFAYSGS